MEKSKVVSTIPKSLRIVKAFSSKQSICAYFSANFLSLRGDKTACTFWRRFCAGIMPSDDANEAAAPDCDSTAVSTTMASSVKVVEDDDDDDPVRCFHLSANRLALDFVFSDNLVLTLVTLSANRSALEVVFSQNFNLAKNDDDGNVSLTVAEALFGSLASAILCKDDSVIGEEYRPQ